MTGGATPAWDLLLARALIQWPERVHAGAVDFAAWTPDRDRFAHFLRAQAPYEAGRLSQTDIDAALGDLLGRARTLTELYKRLLHASGLAVEWAKSQPWIASDATLAWIGLCDEFDGDTMLSLLWADSHRRRSAADDAESLKNWPTVARSGDHELRALWSRGLSDLHIHIGGVRVFQQVWLDLMNESLAHQTLKNMSKIYLDRMTSRLLDDGLDSRTSGPLIRDRNRAIEERREIAGALGMDLADEKAWLKAGAKQPGWWLWSVERLHWERRLLIGAWRRLLDDEAMAQDATRTLATALDRYLFHKHRFYGWARQPAFDGAQGLRAFDKYYFSALKRHDRNERLPGRQTVPPTQRAAADGEAAFRPAQEAFKRQSYSSSPRLVMTPTGDACRYLLESQDLRRVELRMAPMPRATDYWRFFKLWDRLEAQLKADLEGRSVDIRFAIHFVRIFKTPKARVGEAADCGANLFHRLRQLDRESATLRAALACERRGPGLGRLARVDVAGQERDTPCEPYGFHLRLLRGDPDALNALDHLVETAGASNHPHLNKWVALARRGVHRRAAWETPLGLTLHAGEDFADVLDGLYQVASAIEVCGVGGGDTLGHGLALATPSERPGHGSPGRLIQRGAALDSACWLLDLLDREADVGAFPGERRALLKMIEEDFKAIEGLSKSATDVLADWDLGWRWSSDKKSHYQRPAFWDPTAKDLPCRNRERKIDVTPRRQLADAVQFAQTHLKQEVIRRRVVLEINPASNLRISAADEAAANPAVALLQAIADGLLVCINTDNPGVFVSAIENEYALLLSAAHNIKPMLNERDLRGLLESARQIGMEAVR